MDFHLYQHAASQIQHLKFRHASGMIANRAYEDERARILDHYMQLTDGLSFTISQRQRLLSFAPFLRPCELLEEEQRMQQRMQQRIWLRFQRPAPVVFGPPTPPWSAPIPLVRPSWFVPPIVPSSTPPTPKHYWAIPSGNRMPVNQAKMFLDKYFLPYRMLSKGGGQKGTLMFCCRCTECTLVCRLVPIPLSIPLLYNAEVKIGFSEHINHTPEEEEQARKIGLVPVLGPYGNSEESIPLSREVKEHIDFLVSHNPKIKPDEIMSRLAENPDFANLPFLTNEYWRDDTKRKVRSYRQRSKRVSDPAFSVADIQA
jgi:hypothetical protein